MGNQTRITGEVTAVHNDYASVMTREDLPKIPPGSHVTFSICDWCGDRQPRRGQVVALEDLTLFSRGWRALKVSPVQI